MKFFVFLGLATVFSRNFFEYVDGQIPLLPMPFPAAFPFPGMATIYKPIRLKHPTKLENDSQFAANSSGIDSDLADMDSILNDPAQQLDSFMTDFAQNPTPAELPTEPCPLSGYQSLPDDASPLLWSSLSLTSGSIEEDES